jgi:hypothetical protein
MRLIASGFSTRAERQWPKKQADPPSFYATLGGTATRRKGEHMQNRFWIGVGIFLTVLLCLIVMRHHRARVAEDQDAQTTTQPEAISGESTSDAASTKPRPVVHGVPTSTDAGNLAMQWNEWSTAERNAGYRLSPVSEVERRLPDLQVIRQKLADMPMQDDCARAAQRAELASMDADITYFQMQVDNAHTPVGADPQLVKESEDRAANDAYAQAQNASQMAKNCTTP